MALRAKTITVSKGEALVLGKAEDSIRTWFFRSHQKKILRFCPLGILVCSLSARRRWQKVNLSNFN